MMFYPFLEAEIGFSYHSSSIIADSSFYQAPTPPPHPLLFWRAFPVLHVSFHAFYPRPVPHSFRPYFYLSTVLQTLQADFYYSSQGTTNLIIKPCERFSASLVVQTVKNLPAMWETWIWSLGREDPLEKGMATHSGILAWETPGTEKSGKLYSPRGHKESDSWATNTHTHERFQSLSYMIA